MESTIWKDYWTTRDESLRQTLLERHLGLVHHVALGILRKAPPHAELDDLVSAGTIGLLEAVDKFEPDYGLAFSTFAQPRIRGAILDDLRRRDHVSRSQRKRMRDIGQARERLAGELGRDPDARELASALDVPVDTYWKWDRALQRASKVSLDQPLDGAEGREMRPMEVVPDEDAEMPDETVARKEEVDLLREHILELPSREREVLSLYYFEELKLREIAEVFGVTESRISQIRSQAIKRLRKSMAGLRG
jgi:RNA polymerase sigma factor for flagellar operon FliA